MDKLEKALEKARGLRHSIGETVHQKTAAFINKIAGAITIDEETLESHRILAHHARGPEADVFRLLRTQVLQIMNKSGFKTLAITSPHYNDGKTTVALNLAMSIAMDLKQTVLVVDLDLRKPNLHEFLGLEPAAGLHEHLVHGTPLSDCLVRLSIDRLSILPAGAPMDHSSEFLASPHMAALAEEMKERYPDRIIIYDMPPALVQDDSIAFLPHIDAVLLVVKEGVTKTTDIAKALAMLSDANVIGTVLNDHLN